MNDLIRKLAPAPIEGLIRQQNITEILINSHDKIYFEMNGKLSRCEDVINSRKTYSEFLENLVYANKTFFNRERPFAEFTFDDFRVSIISDEVSKNQPLLSLRRLKNNHEALEKNINKLWLSDPLFTKLKELVRAKSNLLIIGGTSTGKTALMNNLLCEIEEIDRCVIIEDTDELILPNSTSVKLLTRPHVNELLPAIGFDELIKRSLRLRPDRLMLGEIRSSEAYNFLLSLSSGHKGCLSSLHAKTAQEALLKLEMLVQLGAPQWSSESIRKLLFLSLDAVVTLEKIEGFRKISEISFICGIENNGLILDDKVPAR